MADELAKRIHYSRTKISRLENASGRPDVADVIKILDALGITGAARTSSPAPPPSASTFNLVKMTEARQRRQELILHPEGPTYTVILDEVVLQRVNVPAGIMAAQVRYLVQLADSVADLTNRLLPVDTYIEGVPIPQAAFSLYTFSAPADPPMVVIETSSSDLPYTGRCEVEQHTKRYDLLSKAVLSSEDSLKRLSKAADRLDRQSAGAGE